MLLLNSIKYPLYEIPEGELGGGQGNLGKEDIIEFLGEDDKEDDIIPLDDKDKKDASIKDKKDEKEKKETLEDETEEERVAREEKEAEEEETDELKEIEDELEEPTEEQLELVTPVRRREILKKFPTLFKEFPYLEKAYYREQQFTEIFPTIPDAKEAVEAKQTLEKVEADLLSGNTQTVLSMVKDENPNGFNKLVDNYLEVLGEVDEKAYHHVIGNVIRHTIVGMVEEARNSSNEALQSAAQVLNQFIFGSSNFTASKKLASDEPDKGKDNELQAREDAFLKKQFETSSNDLITRVDNALKSTIDANIDPKKSMTDYVRRTASREALETLNILIEKDTRFKVVVDKLWEKVFDDNFSKSSIDRVRSAYFSRAKTLLPAVIKKARNEALKGLGKRVSATDDDDKSDRKGPVRKEGPQSHERKSGKITKASEIPKTMRTLDFLSQD